jgi:hypothetical protein
MSTDCELRLGAWQRVLADVECDVLITDPPYGSRTHAGHDAGVEHTEIGESKWDTARRRGLPYGFWTPGDVREFVEHWSPRTAGWFCAMSCSDLFPVWRSALEDAGRVAFAPIPCTIRAMSVRLAGDGPSNWAVYLNVARPRSKEWSTWGTRDGAYVTGRGKGARHIGGKPLELMRAIVRDYSRPGDLIADPCAGYATTAIAALGMGRRFIGSEIDPVTHARGSERLRGGFQMEMLG